MDETGTCGTASPVTLPEHMSNGNLTPKGDST